VPDNFTGSRFSALRFDHKSSEAIDLGRNIKGRYSCATPKNPECAIQSAEPLPGGASAALAVNDERL
jgi:hypothetical protein